MSISPKLFDQSFIFHAVQDVPKNPIILVSGGRDYKSNFFEYEVLDEINRLRQVSLLICGDATGADAIAANWADSRSIEKRVYEAKWNLFGKSAGMIRNSRMASENSIDLAVFFPGGRGTANMKKIIVESGVKYLEIQ